MALKAKPKSSGVIMSSITLVPVPTYTPIDTIDPFHVPTDRLNSMMDGANKDPALNVNLSSQSMTPPNTKDETCQIIRMIRQI